MRQVQPGLKRRYHAVHAKRHRDFSDQGVCADPTPWITQAQDDAFAALMAGRSFARPQPAPVEACEIVSGPL